MGGDQHGRCHLHRGTSLCGAAQIGALRARWSARGWDHLGQASRVFEGPGPFLPRFSDYAGPQNTRARASSSPRRAANHCERDRRSMTNVERVDVGGDRDPNAMGRRVHRLGLQAMALCTEHGGDPIGNFHIPEVDRVDIGSESPGLKAGIAECVQGPRPILGACPGDRDVQDLTHAYSDGAPLIRIVAGRADNHAVDAKRSGGPGDCAHILIVIERFEHDQTATPRRQLGHRRHGGSKCRRETTAVHVEANDLGKDCLLGDIDRHLCHLGPRHRWNETLQTFRMQQNRTHAMPRVEHPVNRDISLAHEILVSLHFGSHRDAVQLAIVVETRICRVHDVRDILAALAALAALAVQRCSGSVRGHRPIISPNSEQLGFSHIDGSQGASGGSALTPHVVQIGEMSPSSVSSHKSLITSVSLSLRRFVRRSKTPSADSSNGNVPCSSTSHLSASSSKAIRS